MSSNISHIRCTVTGSIKSGNNKRVQYEIFIASRLVQIFQVENYHL